MLSLRRVLVATAIAVPLTIGGAGVALADGFHSEDATAGPGGVSADYISAATHEGHHGHFHGGASYAELHATTGPDGPTDEWIFAVADGNGGVAFAAGQDTAGPQGVSSSAVSAVSGHRG